MTSKVTILITLPVISYQTDPQHYTILYLDMMGKHGYHAPEQTILLQAQVFITNQQQTFCQAHPRPVSQYYPHPQKLLDQ